jgi:hypothetical protein
VLTAAAVTSAKAAADDAASKQQLDSQLQRSLGSTKEAIAANEEWVNGMSDATAVARDELRPALAGAVRATGDLTQAHALLKSALDVSAATGKPLSSVIAALGKAYTGSTGALKKLAPSISDAALKSGDYARIQAELNKQFGGAAKGAADTQAGQYRKMQNAMHELQVEIGTALLPVMAAGLPVATEVFGVFAGHSDVIVAIAAAVGGFAAAILVANAALSAYETIQSVSVAVQAVWNSELLASIAQGVAYTASLVAMQVATIATSAATKAYAVAQWLLNAALDANPIGLAIIAVAALTAGIVLAYKHSATFRNIVQSAAVAKQNAVLLLGLIGLIIRAFMRCCTKTAARCGQGVTAALHAITDAIQGVLHAFHAGRCRGGRARRAGSCLQRGGRRDQQPDIGGRERDRLDRADPLPSKPSWIPFAVPRRAERRRIRGRSTGPVINVTINGAIDPESTAIAIRRTLERTTAAAVSAARRWSWLGQVDVLLNGDALDRAVVVADISIRSGRTRDDGLSAASATVDLLTSDPPASRSASPDQLQVVVDAAHGSPGGI